MNKKDKKARQQISKIINLSVQILNELPKDEVDALGGEAALVERTRINITDSLYWSGLQEWGDKIKKTNMDKIRRIEDFIDTMRQMFETSLA